MESIKSTKAKRNGSPHPQNQKNRKEGKEDEEVIRSMACFLQERVQPDLAIPRWFRYNRNHHHLVLPWSHR
ncbi:hypothetical protein V6N13_009539 [Hibiscus sabdariffa]|uniref:Uncharacterized protein n=1 Tax=Hibiscus sabdariffa TaxID=183260 RepID=A0ABR2AMD6_9ROSI